MQLVFDWLHVPTIKDLFGLSSVNVEGIAEPTDTRGFALQCIGYNVPYKYRGLLLQVCSTPWVCYVVLLTLRYCVLF